MSAAHVPRCGLSREPAVRVRQRGWSLVEAVVVVLLLGFMAVGLWKMVELVERGSRSERSRDVLQRAEDALQGLLLRDNALPRPEDDIVSPDRPNHLEGWLPVSVLGTEPPRRIRYLVDASLVTPPATPLYRPDPLNLLPGLAPRDSVNGLDVCLHLIEREWANVTVAGNGMRLAVGLQQVDASRQAGPQAGRFLIEDRPASTREASGQVQTRSAGYVELVHRLGCVPAFARLATEVKAAVLVGDLHEQGELNEAFRRLGVRQTRESGMNADWRMANSSLRLTGTVWGSLKHLRTATRTEPGRLIAASNLVADVMMLALWGLLLKLSEDGEKSAAKKLPEREAALEEARRYAQHLERQREWHLQRIRVLQNSGVMP